ncbi:DUF1877 family protein [Dongia sp. agr-C8]
MGMVCELQALSARQIAALCDDPAMAEDVIFGPPEAGSATLADEPLREQLSLDKCWDLLRFMMNKAGGQDVPDRKDWSSELLLSDEDADLEVDAGYGPPYLRSIAETKKFADFLQSLTVEQLLSHWNTSEMLKAKIYLVSEEKSPEAQEENDRRMREYAGSYYPELRDYVLKAAAADCGLLLWIG